MLFVVLTAASSIEGSSSGKHNQAAAGCTCHYNGGGITATHDFPSTYNPGQTYNINIGLSGGTQAFVGGFSLQVNKGTLSNPGSLVKIQSGSSATHTNSGSLYWALDWTAPSSGSGTVSMNLAVLQGDGNNQNSGDAWDQESASIAEYIQPNTLPIASDLTLSPNGNVGVDQSLTLSYTYTDGDGDPESNSQIRWFVDGNLQIAFNDLLTIPSSATTVGETWTAKVTPNDGKDLGLTKDCPDSANIIDIDSDGDGTFDLDDDFPNDSSEQSDSDGDGVGDNADVFPNDASETMDSDGDNVGDNADVFPNDSSETMDSDGDMVGDNADAFPNDSSEQSDSDGDGVGDNADVFPNDSSETMDSDGDMVGDNADAFPNDANETMDSDGDMVGDNADAFPNDASETMDSDGDMVGDNADAFPNDANETMDSDGDMVGDNGDVFPNDANETMDSDGDGVGDNGDAFPNDASETMDSDGDGVGDNRQLASEEKAAQQQLMIIVAIATLLVGGAVAGILLMRKKENVVDSEKGFNQNVMSGQFQPVGAGVQQAIAQPVVAQPAVVESAVVQQWSDEAGNTWRTMDNGTTLWWNGTDWQQV
jgi:hypothetical protein